MPQVTLPLKTTLCSCGRCYSSSFLQLVDFERVVVGHLLTVITPPNPTKLSRPTSIHAPPNFSTDAPGMMASHATETQPR